MNVSGNVGPAVDLLDKLKAENETLTADLAKANQRIARLEEELNASEEELSMYEEAESRHI